MRGLVPRIHVSTAYLDEKTWMAATSAAMTMSNQLSLKVDTRVMVQG
jgi:hypothetical protein